MKLSRRHTWHTCKHPWLVLVPLACFGTYTTIRGMSFFGKRMLFRERQAHRGIQLAYESLQTTIKPGLQLVLLSTPRPCVYSEELFLWSGFRRPIASTVRPSLEPFLRLASPASLPIHILLFRRRTCKSPANVH